MQEIYLVRHTITEVKPGTCYGRADVDVRGDFRDAATKIKALLPDNTEFDLFYSSPLKRCTRLAELLSADNKNIITDERLMELDFGSWEMKRWDDIPREEMDTWCSNYEKEAVHGGETYTRLIERSMAFWNDMILSKPQKSLIVTHAGVIRSIVASVLEMPPRNAFSIHLDYGQIVQISVYSKENFKVRFIN